MNLKFCLVLERMTAVSLAPGTDVVGDLADPAGGWLAVPEFIDFHYQCWAVSSESDGSVAGDDGLRLQGN